MRTEFLDKNLRDRESMGDTPPTPGRLRLTGDIAKAAAYDNLADFLGAAANIDPSHNVEIESSGGVWLPVDLLWGLLALRRYEIVHGANR